MAGLGQVAPVHVTMARLAAGIRGSVTVVAVAAAIVGAAGVSAGWLIPALVGLVAWTSVYVWVTLVSGLQLWVVLTDMAFATLLCLALGRLVPAAAIAGGSSWVANVASMAVICAQVRGQPRVTVPAGLLVAGTFLVGSALADSPDRGVNETFILTTQTIIAALVMRVVVRAGQRVADAFARHEKAVQAEAFTRARAEEVRGQLRHIHDGPATTMTMATIPRLWHLVADLRQRAAIDVASLEQMQPTTTLDSDDAASLAELISSTLVEYKPLLMISSQIHECVVPAVVADAFAQSVAEALQNVVRHAQVSSAEVHLQVTANVVRVTVDDLGRGFDASNPARYGFGLSEAICGRMAAVGGGATIRSSPGRGTTVILEWRHDRR